MSESAGDVGNRLVAEIEEATLDKILLVVGRARSSTTVSRDFVGSILNAYQGFEQHHADEPVIEIISARPGAGKTQLLYSLTATALVGRYNNNGSVSSDPGSVVVFDTDGRFDIDRLTKVVQAEVAKEETENDLGANRHSSTYDWEHIVFESLKHVHIFRPQSLAVLQATVQHLPAYLSNLPSHHSRHRRLALIVLDSSGAFLWQQTHRGDTTPFDEGRELLNNKEALRDPSAATNDTLVSALRDIQGQFACPIVSSAWGITPNDSVNRVGPSLRPILPQVWQNFVTHSLVVMKGMVKKFPLGMTVEGASRDREARQKALDESTFSAWVNCWRCDEWTASVWDSYREVSRNRGLLSFTVSHESVDISFDP